MKLKLLSISAADAGTQITDRAMLDKFALYLFSNSRTCRYRGVELKITILITRPFRQQFVAGIVHSWNFRIAKMFLLMLARFRGSKIRAALKKSYSFVEYQNVLLVSVTPWKNLETRSICPMSANFLSGYLYSANRFSMFGEKGIALFPIVEHRQHFSPEVYLQPNTFSRSL